MLTENIHLEPINDHLGVRLCNVEFESAARDPAFIQLMKKLLDDHLLVVIPKQHIEPNTAEEFLAHFGPLVDMKRAGNKAHHVPHASWVKVISNGLAPDGIPWGDGNSSAQIWHSDSTAWEAPVGHVLFYCRQTVNPIPSTYLKNMIKVYEALPETVKGRIADVRVIHHFYPRQIETAIHATGSSMSLDERRRGFAHPLVRRHLGSNKPLLYLPVRRDSIIQGWSEEESRRLLEELWDFTNQQDFDCALDITPDDCVIWDNRATIHSRDGWPADQTRIMWHISAEGEVPTPMHTRRGLNTIGLDPEKARSVTATIYNHY